MSEPIQTPEDGTESVEETTITTPPADETPDSQETPADPVPGPALQEPDYKEKFGASTRENQILRDKLKKLESRRELTDEPTEAELRAAFPSWDSYTDSEREIARGQLATRRMSEAALRAQKEREEREEFDRQLEIAITSNPSLEGKERAFKEFASKPQYRGASTDVLVDAFLHRSGAVAKPKREPQPGLETGTGGPKVPAKPTTLTGEQIAELRKTDYSAYLDYVKKHDIDV